MVSICRHKVSMHSGPETTSPIKWEFGLGYPLKVISRKGNWLKVADYESDTGWVDKKLVGKTPYMIVKNEETIIRNGPGEKQRIVGESNRGVVLRTIKHKKGWVQVKHESGLTGWIRRDLLWGW
ncbi:MAG: SH3 domain-containing protein [Desulfurivibrionaceae bacterium]